MDRERPIGYWLKLVDRLLDDAFDDVFLGTGLTRRHWQVLTMIRDGVGDPATVEGVLSTSHGAVPPGHIAGVSAEIDDLRTRGWVGQGPTGLEVTVTGQAAYHDLIDAASMAREKLADGITREEYDQTIATLERMARNLGWSH